MIAVAERPIAAVRPEAPPPLTGTEARAVALAYLQYASACWRGDPLATVFEARLRAFWCPEMPPVPATVPDAVSLHGGGGRGLCWRQVGDEILGHVPGARGGYQIPVGDIPRLVECTRAGARLSPAGGRHG